MTVIISPHPPEHLGGVKGQILEFHNYSKAVNVFTESLLADRGTINMKHIKRDFRLKACVSPPGWTLGMGSKSKIRTQSCCISKDL